MSTCEGEKEAVVQVMLDRSPSIGGGGCNYIVVVVVVVAAVVVVVVVVASVITFLQVISL